MVNALRALPMRGSCPPAQHVAPAQTKYKSRQQLEAERPGAPSEETRGAKYHRSDRGPENQLTVPYTPCPKINLLAPGFPLFCTGGSACVEVRLETFGTLRSAKTFDRRTRRRVIVRAPKCRARECTGSHRTLRPGQFVPEAGRFAV